MPYEDVAKGYELPDGEMIVLTDEDMADLPLATSKSIEVMHFAPADQLDPILFNRSYYVEPENAGVRAYACCATRSSESGKIAIAQVALRQRESLATLRTRDGVLVLETLLWPDEVRAADFPFLDDDVEVRSQELRMASSLIDSMTVDFDPDEYHDRYREALQELVEAKIEGREVLQPEAEADSRPSRPAWPMPCGPAWPPPAPVAARRSRRTTPPLPNGPQPPADLRAPDRAGPRRARRMTISPAAAGRPPRAPAGPPRPTRTRRLQPRPPGPAGAGRPRPSSRPRPRRPRKRAS